MGRGQANTLITFERNTPSQNSSGEEVESWATFGQPAMAEVFWGLGSERRQAAAEQRVQSATFQALSTPTSRSVTVTDRISEAGGLWNIVGIAPGRRPRTIEFTATRSS